jgi:hypothetical protein
MKKLLLFVSLLLCLNSSGQVGISIYNTKAMGVGFPLNKRLFGEVKAYSNMYIASMRMEGDFCVNLKRTETLNIYAGFGAIIVPYSGDYVSFSVPLGLQISPFESLRKLSLVMEIAPEISDEVYLRSLWGLRYSFR